jgi:hypothetical protein
MGHEPKAAHVDICERRGAHFAPMPMGGGGGETDGGDSYAIHHPTPGNGVQSPVYFCISPSQLITINVLSPFARRFDTASVIGCAEEWSAISRMALVDPQEPS